MLPYKIFITIFILSHPQHINHTRHMHHKIMHIVHVAKKFLGMPYVYGDTGLFGYDCSSFVQKVFHRNGFDLPRTSREQLLVGTPVALENIQAGDLLFFTSDPDSKEISHVAISIGGHQMIHAAHHYHRVVISNWDSPYYRNRWFAARRIAND